MMFLDCPAWLDQDGTVRCGLPAEVRRRFTMRSSGGPLEGAMIRCPAGHWFNGSIESLTWDSSNKHSAGTAGAASGTSRASLTGGHDGRDGRGGFAVRENPAGPGQKISRPNIAPAYYLGRPAHVWIIAMRSRRSPTASTRWKPSAAARNELDPSAAAL